MSTTRKITELFGYKTQIYYDGIAIGCTWVSVAKVERILDIMNKLAEGAARDVSLGEFTITISQDAVALAGSKEAINHKTVERILRSIKKSSPDKFKTGAYVRVIKNIGDSHDVFGLTGRIVRSDRDGDGIVIYFKGWHNGHGGHRSTGDSSWYVDRDALKIVDKPKE